MFEQPRNIIEEFVDRFEENSFWQRLRTLPVKIGRSAIYRALLLYYAYRRKATPAWAKRIVFGALGYLIAPIDFIPDLAPIIGFTDDVWLMGFALSVIAFYVNDEVRAQAKDKLESWFGPTEVKEIIEVEGKRLEE